MTESLKRKWWEYHKQNPHVYSLVERFTFDGLDVGLITTPSTQCSSVSDGTQTSD